ncbi:MAG: penicillin-binding protein 1A [Gammaproteobacteria bacterium]|nr:MAG: penicillin-binding protein 1A [Gammaproteobacteria bacterium]
MSWLKKLFKFGVVVALTGALVGAAAFVAAYLYIAPDLPDIEALREVQLQVPLRIYASEGELIAEFGEKRRTPVTYDQLPTRLVQAITAAEDAAFFSHPGIDPRGLLRAGIKLILTGKRAQGGSTITMQVARNFYLSRRKTYLRKLYEIFLALRIEQELSKKEILELYLNKIYLGHRAYGVAAAARVYYGKDLSDLTLPEIAMIAGLPKAPSAYNPLSNPERAVARRNYVLRRMRELGHISQQEYDEAVAAPVTARRYAPKIEVEAPYVAEMVRKRMLERYGEAAYTSGIEVHTTLSAKAQTAANRALRRALHAYSERHGYRGPIRHVDEIPVENEARDALLAKHRRFGEIRPALVLTTDEHSAEIYLGEGETGEIPWQGLKWARPYIDTNRRGKPPKIADDVIKVGDLIMVRPVTERHGKKESTFWKLTQLPKVSGALISLRARDGAMLALVGGYDFYQSKFNRVTQALRQPGSGFKPFIYSAALEKGFTPASLINDAPVVFDDPALEGAWRPENYSGKFFGPTRLRWALTKSRNLVSIRLLRSIGIDYAVQYAARFGFDPDQLPHNLSLALGSANVNPLQMARGYAVLANGGFLIQPYLIQRIVRNGKTEYEATPLEACPNCPVGEIPEPTSWEDGARPEHAPRTLTPQNRYLMYSMMQDVIQRGTGIRARVLGRKDIAGKTGTTNDQRDAWFNGYNQSVVANVWVGFDDNRKLGRGEVGGKAALPAWIDYMREVLAGTEDRPPQMPPDMVTVRIDPKTGQRARAGTTDAIFEIFRKGNEPSMESSGSEPSAPNAGEGPEQPTDLF